MVRAIRLSVGVLLVLLILASALRAQTSPQPLALSERPGGDAVNHVVADGSGGVWVTGYTWGNLPTTADALQPAMAGTPFNTSDAFVMHIGADGSRLYATYLGGSSNDAGTGIARDSAGNVYVVGNTSSLDFPTTANAFSRYAPTSYGPHAFVTKLDPSGKHVLYSTYLGGGHSDQGVAVAADASGRAHVVGSTQGFNFPVTWGRCLSYSTSQESTFYTVFSPDGSQVAFSTCLDDSGPADVTLDASGDAWVVGHGGAQFGPRMGSYTGSAPNGGNGYLTKFTPGASNPIPISMYVGGDVNDTANAVAVTAKGVYIAGWGYSHNYPGGATRPPEPHTYTLDDGRQVTSEGSTAWIMKVALDGTQVLGTTLINGNGDLDRALALQVDSNEVVHVTGDTDSTDFPVSNDAPQRTLGGWVDAWYAQAWMPNNIVADPTYLTYLGGAQTDRGLTLAFDGDGGDWIAGETNSTNFPSVNAQTVSTTNTFIARYGAVRGTPSAEYLGNVVLYTRDASPIVGDWHLTADSLAANNIRIWNPDHGVPKIATPSANPANYFEMTFQAQAGVPYHLWLRLFADFDSYQNDSVWVQFSDSVDAGGNPIWRTGTTSGTALSLEDCSGCGDLSPGWNDNGYGTAGSPVYFATSGTHTIRIQQREDGVSIDQIVLSSTTWANSAPGANKNDRTIVPQGTTPPPPPPPSNQAPSVTITSPASGTTIDQSSWPVIIASASDSDGSIAKVDFYANSTLLWTDTSAPYRVSWESMPEGTYTVTAVATDNNGASAASSPVTITVAARANGQLPWYWTDQDIGDVGAAGSATYSNGTFTVQGSGADVWGTADAFHYVDVSTGSLDASIVARVASVSDEANWVKAGVMMRASPDPDAEQAFMFVSHAKGVCFQRRVATGGTSTSTCGTMSTAPRWVKLMRVENVVSGYESADGTNWTLVGSDTFTNIKGTFAGLAVSSHVRGTLATATFDHVWVLDAEGPNSPPTVSLTSPADGATFTAPATVPISINALDDTGVTRIDLYANSTLIGTLTGNSDTSEYSFTWSNVAAGTYTLTAVAFDSWGSSSASQPVSITVNDTQPSNECSSLALSQTTFYSGGPASDWRIAVTAPNETCTWTASVDQSWLLLGVQSGPTTITGTGSGTVRLQTVDNRTGAYRYGTFTIGGVAYKVTQEPY